MCIFLKNQNLKNQDATSFGPCLQVDFLELLCYDKEFAKDVCNGKGTHDYWLRKAANKFCNENGFPTDNASIQFINMPYSIYSASSVLSLSPCSKKVFLCGNRLAKDVATAHGREKLRIILWDILDLLLSGESWEEKLTIHDMMFAQVTKDPKSLKLVIAKRSGTRKKEDPRVGIKPLQEIWTAVEPYYKVGKNGLPLYMAQLKISLNGATELSEDLVLYLRYHPSLCSSVGRKILVDGIHQARKEFKMEKLPGFYSCFMNKPYKGDWREAAKEMDILKQLHDFRFEAPAQMKSANKEKGKTDSLDNESSRNVEKMQKIGEEEKGGIASEDECRRTQEDRTVEDKAKQISEVQNVEKIQNVSEKRNTTSGNCEGKKIEKERTGVDKAKQNSEEKENYLDSSWSLLGYNRNGHQHLGQYVVVQDPDEVELFLAAFFEDFLPDMIDKLLTACKMTGVFASAWSAYKACILSDDQEPPCIERPK